MNKTKEIIVNALSDAHFGVILADDHGTILLVNRAAETLLGHDKLLGQKLRCLIPESVYGEEFVSRHDDEVVPAYATRLKAAIKSGDAPPLSKITSLRPLQRVTADGEVGPVTVVVSSTLFDERVYFVGQVLSQAAFDERSAVVAQNKEQLEDLLPEMRAFLQRMGPKTSG